jgi:hypothetical protein
VGRQIRQRPRDFPITAVHRVKVPPRRRYGRVSETLHQVSHRRARLGSQRLAGVPQIVKREVVQANVLLARTYA